LVIIKTPAECEVRTKVGLNLLDCDRVYKSIYFCCSFPFFKNINEVVASITSVKIANCFSSTMATTRIAAAHMIELEINNFLIILCRHLYLLHRNRVELTRPFFIYYSSAQKFFKLPFDENNFDSVFGANQKINIEKKIRLTPTIIPTSPSDERISNTPIMLYLMRVGKMKPKTRIKKYKVVNILNILKTDFIAYLILCSKSLHCNGVNLNDNLLSTISAVFRRVEVCLHELLIFFQTYIPSHASNAIDPIKIAPGIFKTSLFPIPRIKK
jgi:hypothetical protein